MMEQDNIPEDIFHDLGFSCDKDVNGNEVLRAAGLLQESYQPSNYLTHEFQINLCKEYIKHIKYGQRCKADQRQQKRNEEVHSIELIEEKLLNMIAEDAEVMERSLDQCTVEMFDKLTSPKLSDFIWAHDANVIIKKDIPCNKGRL